MAQLVNYVPCQHEDLKLAPQYLCKKQGAVCVCNPRTGDRDTEVDLRSPLARQSSETSELRVQGQTLLQNIRWE